MECNKFKFHEGMFIRTAVMKKKCNLSKKIRCTKIIAMTVDIQLGKLFS